jgi:hypothetical protein
MAKVAIQGGVKNYLPSKEVTVPVEAKSSENHVKAHLAYITDKEQDLLIKKNLHGSLKGKPNRGPGGLPSLQGDFGPGGNNPGGFSSNQGGKGGTGNTADKGGIGTGDESAFTDKGTGKYTLSTRPQDRQTIIDYAQGKLGYQGGKKPGYFNNRLNFKAKNQLYNLQQNISLANKRAFQKYRDIEQYVDLMDDYGLSAEEIAAELAANPSYGYDFSGLGKGKSKLGSNIGTNLEKFRENLYDVNSQLTGRFSLLNPVFDKVRPDTQVTAMNTLNKARAYNALALDPTISKGKLDALANLGKTPDQINPPKDGDGPQPYLPFDYNTGAATVKAVEPYTNDFVYRFGDEQKVGADVLRGYVANGGRITRAGGGIMNAVPRQGYFLGKIVKGVGKAIGSVADAAGKVLKSDVGKMALLAAGAYYTGGALGGTGGFSNAFTSTGNFGVLGSKALQGAKFLGKKALFTNGALDFGKAAILGASALPFFMKQPEDPDIGMAERGGRLIDPLTGEEGTPASMRANIENAKIEADGDPVKLASLNQKYNNMLFSILPYENYGTYAQGGRIRAQEGGLMNLGGMEKDYRAEGGFVPIGKQEKADDVPARLSVNEFVFTADAVRNAGGGDIDKGAEVMENMMKNLENGGRVSEESQGNTGAQQMFSVSERIGEVI